MIAPIEHIGGAKTGMNHIESACETFERESSRLDALVAALEADLEAVRQKHLKAIKRQAGVVACEQAELQRLIESAPDLFVRPRTITAHGVKVGLVASEGKLKFEDEEMVIGLIEHHFGHSAARYIRTTREVNKDSLKLLSAAELKKIGCWIEDAGDGIVLKRMSGDVEKLINKLINKMAEAMADAE